jgi:pectate lyase
MRHAPGFWIPICLIVAALCAQAFADPIPAFPGAEGFGAMTPGGRGGGVLLVTNLEDYVPGEENPVPGSLRAAIEAKGPRIVVFRVAGIIALKTTLKITEPYLTIAGQSAPGDGVCLKDFGCSISETHDIVIRYMRFRPGDFKGVELDALGTGGGCKNILIDHCSTSWSNDETLSVSGAGQDNITVQWCMITESMNQSHHKKGAHGYGTLLRTDGKVTFHHNLYAHHATRCPRPGTYGEDPGLLLDFRNNVVYNWKSPAGYTAKDAARIDYIGNYLKPGPSTTDRDHAFSIGGETTKMYVADVVVEGTDAKDWALISNAADIHKAAEPFPVALVNTDTAEEAFQRVLEGCGATLPVRDAVDARVVDTVRNGTGCIINSQADVGGWPEYKSAEAPPDTDQDGMPDTWEAGHGLNPSDAADAVGDKDGDGYTSIEEFLNGTDPETEETE